MLGHLLGKVCVMLGLLAGLSPVGWVMCCLLQPQQPVQHHSGPGYTSRQSQNKQVCMHGTGWHCQNTKESVAALQLAAATTGS
jgi:hypothetical protein